jgi:hypothetical protein
MAQNLMEIRRHHPGLTTMKNLFYYRLEDAQQIKSTFASWIGKQAHIGNGRVETLKAIAIRPKRQIRSISKSREFFKVEFEFEGEKKFSVHEFIFHNSLESIHNHPLIASKKQVKAA